MSSGSSGFLEKRRLLWKRNKDPQQQRRAFIERSTLLVSNLKKATALAKRFKNYAAETSEKVILEQLDSLSFGMFISEAAQGVVQSLFQGTKMKPSDAHSLAVVCSEVHQRYEEFWPLVQKGLKENTEKIFGLDVLNVLVEHMEASATVGSASTNTNNAVAATGAPGGNSGAAAAGKAAAEEFNRLTLVAKVICEWWLVGLLDDAKPLLGFLTKVHCVMEKWLPSPPFPATVVCLLSLSVSIVREVGIEMLEETNTLVHFMGHGAGGSVRLRDLVGCRGTLEEGTSNSKLKKEDVFFMGPVGIRRVFNPLSKKAVLVDEITAQRAEEISVARLNSVRGLHGSGPSREAERVQFFELAVNTSRVALQLYLWHKAKLENWCQLAQDQGEWRARPPKGPEESSQFRMLSEQTEKLYVSCDDLLGMLGYTAPPPVQSITVKPRTTADTVATSATKKIHTVVDVETVNRFESDEQRIFYEYIPDILCISNDLLGSLLNEKPRWNYLARWAFFGHSGDTNASGSRKGEVLEEGSQDEDVSASGHQLEEEGTKQSQFGGLSPPADRRLWLAELVIPASLFDKYAAILQLLEELDNCECAGTIDAWCERYMLEALRPLMESPECIGFGRVFFTNCRMLLVMEALHFPRTRQPDIAMVPFVSRCVAVFSQYFLDMGEFIGGRLESHWRLLYRASNSISDGELRSQLECTIRYLCDLTKFGVVTHLSVFGVLRAAMEDLHNRISPMLIAYVMKYCGLFLSCEQSTRQVLEGALKRLKSMLSQARLSDEQVALIETSLGCLQGPFARRLHVEQVERSSLERYVLHLLNNVLSRRTYESVCEGLLKMPWKDPAKREVLVTTLREVQHVKYDNIPLLADLLSDFVRVGYDSLVLRIVETIAEDLRRDMEVPPPEAQVEATPEDNEPLYYERASGLHAVYRPMNLRLLDCFFVTQLCRARVVSFRFVGYMVALLTCYTPHPDARSTDWSRLRCCVTLLTESLSFLPLETRNKPRSVDHVGSLHQFFRKMMSLLFVHRYTFDTVPPLDLSRRLGELLTRLNECMHQRSDTKRTKGRKKDREYRRKGEGKPLGFSLEAPPAVPGVQLPKSMEEAMAYAKAVEEEQVLPENVWYDTLCANIKRSCSDDLPHCRILAAQARKVSVCQTVSTVSESGEGNSNESLPDDADLAHDDVSSHESDTVGSDSETVYGSRRLSYASNSRSSTDVNSIAERISALSGYIEPGSDLTRDGDEEDGNDNGKAVDSTDDGEESEESGDGYNRKVAAAEALRIKAEEAALDAELHALMTENQRDNAFRAACITTKGSAAERLIEQDLTAAIRLHRQQRMQQAPAPIGGDTDGQEVRFVLLRRPGRGSGVSANTKSGADAQSAAANEGTDKNILVVPRDAEFAQSAFRQQEQKQAAEGGATRDYIAYQSDAGGRVLFKVLDYATPPPSKYINMEYHQGWNSISQ